MASSISELDCASSTGAAAFSAGEPGRSGAWGGFVGAGPGGDDATGCVIALSAALPGAPFEVLEAGDISAAGVAPAGEDAVFEFVWESMAGGWCARLGGRGPPEG